MKATLKLAIVANCQARPLKDLLLRLGDRITVAGIVVTHLARPSEEAATLDLLNSVDFVLGQAVQDAFPTRFVRTSYLRERCGERLVTWPSLFFKGQTPDLVYVSQPEVGRIAGPLGEYQHRLIFDAWRSGATAEQATRGLMEGGAWLDPLPAEAEASLAQLRQREAGLDVAIADDIAVRWRDERQFFTFNHPTKALLGQVAARLLARIGVSPAPATVYDDYPEPLARIIPALLPVVVDRLGLKLRPDPWTKGCAVDLSAHSGRRRKRVVQPPRPCGPVVPLPGSSDHAGHAGVHRLSHPG